MKLMYISLAIFFATGNLLFSGPLRVVTTLPEFASIAEEIGGEKVTTTALMRGNQDAHYIEPRPSMAVRLRNADLLIVNGMELDIWVFSLMDVARNSAITFGRQGYLDVSADIDKMEVLPPGTRIDASMGHVHPGGNPHYTLDPESGKVVARQIMERMSLLSPENAEFFEANYRKFAGRLDEKIAEWKTMIEEADIGNIITYHRNWPYFARTFGLNLLGELEPLPGIPPSPGHLARLVETIRQEDVRAILMVDFYDIRPARFVQDRADVRIVRVPMHVGGVPGAQDYISFIDTIVGRLVGEE